jgi:hypothetical protein
MACLDSNAILLRDADARISIRGSGRIDHPLVPISKASGPVGVFLPDDG